MSERRGKDSVSMPICHTSSSLHSGEDEEEDDAVIETPAPDAGFALRKTATMSIARRMSVLPPLEGVIESDAKDAPVSSEGYPSEANEVIPDVSPIFAGAEISEDLKALFADPKFSLFGHAVERWPADKPAVLTCGRNMTGPMKEFSYGDVRNAAYFGANLMHSNGIRKGHKVLLCQWNSWECVVAYWATHCLGAVAVVVTPTHIERKYLIKYTACRCIVTPESTFEGIQKEIDDRTFVNLVLLTDLQESASSSDSRRGSIVRAPCQVDPLFLDDEFDVVEPGSYEVIGFDGSGCISELSADAKAERESIQRLDECLWYFTSGTTGKPKGCVHNQIDLAFAAETYGKTCMYCADGVLTATDVLMAGPYAMGSNLIFPFIAGGKIFLDHIDKSNMTGLPSGSFPILRIAKPELFVSIPGTIQNLASEIAGNCDEELLNALKHLKIITSAGAPLPPPAYCNVRHASKSQDLKIEVLDGIGTSELQHIFISNKVGDTRSDTGSIGTVIDGYEIRLLNAVQKDQTWKGELAVRTKMPDIVVKYSNDRAPRCTNYDDATEEANFHADDAGASWYITGDVALAELDNGTWYFYLLGRTKDLASQINDGAERHMGIEDHLRRQLSNGIMFTVGLLEKADEVQKSLGKEPDGRLRVFADNVYPIVLTYQDEEVCIYVVSVTAYFWENAGDTSSMKPEDMKVWVEYIVSKSSSEALLFFSPDGSIPRTPPPLLKPKVGDMKKKLQSWVDAEKPSKIDQDFCTQLSCSQRLTK